MCELFAMSSFIETSVSFSLREFSRHGGKTGKHSDGWGLATYKGKKAVIHREEAATAFSQKLKYIQAHPDKTHCVISHIRTATVGAKSLRNTQPFTRELFGRSHVFAHNGDLLNIESKLEIPGCVLEGETDPEYAFCYLITQLRQLWMENTPTLKQRIDIIKQVFTDFTALGPANFLHSDGDYLYVFANKRTQLNGQMEPPSMYYLPRQYRCDSNSLKQSGVDIDCAPPEGFIICQCSIEQ